MNASTEHSDERLILLVDDDQTLLRLLARRLGMVGYRCDTESDGFKAIHRVKSTRYDLIILDINMPHLNGTEMLLYLQRLDRDIPVVMISGMDSIDIVRKTLREGAYDYLAKPFDLDELELTLTRALQHGHQARQIKQYQRNLEKQVTERTRDLAVALEQIRKTYDATILALGSALEIRDIETEIHALRVAHFSHLLATALGITDEDVLTNIQRGAYLHDIGKIGVPDAILLKPGLLTDDEWTIMRKHPEIGREIIEGIEFLEGIIPLVYCHHERHDGKGYPRGLSGNAIPVGARIFSVADALDAMTSDRPYRKAMSVSEAKQEILVHSGSQFDPVIVEGLMNIENENLATHSSLALNGASQISLNSDVMQARVS